MSRVLYFGCIGTPGHFLVEEDKLVHPRNKNIPWKIKELDMRLCPGVKRASYGYKADRQVEGEAKLHHKDGWTAIAFWDRSVDYRRNSNSVFIVEGIHAFEEAKEIAKSSYPSIWKRFGFDVRLA